MNELQINITGMTCSACSARIEKALLRMEGVRQASVSLATSTAGVRWEGGIPAEQVLERIRKLGYGASLAAAAGRQTSEAEYYRRRFIWSAALSLPLLAAMAAHLSAPLAGYVPSWWLHPYVQLALGSALLLAAGVPFYRGAWNALRQGAPNMDVLIASSTAVAYLYSQRLVFRGGAAHSLYFDSIAMVLTAVTLGKWLEALARGSALRSLQSLRELRPATARAIRDGRERVVPAGELAAGESFAVASGERVPADGMVTEGAAELDESPLTGESAIAVRGPGERLLAGALVVGGAAVVRAEGSGDRSRLSAMIALVEQAQQSKPRLARRVDAIAAYFVPAMLLLAALTFGLALRVVPFDEATGRAMAVLLTACPCALGLAAPISLVIASGLALKAGVVVKEAGLLETLGRADAFVFDKTGTLTEGRAEVADIRAASLHPATLLRLAAALEAGSAHPYAQALVREAEVRGLRLPSVRRRRERSGMGVRGEAEGREIVVGSAAWLDSHGILPDSSFGTAGPVLHVAVDGRWAGLIALRDRLRADALPTLRRLADFGELWMATGDREQAACGVAAAAGIRNVRAGLLPEQKLELLEALRADGRRVVMIGDGANDTAALAAADVGVALASGHDAALEAGDIVVAGGRLSKVADIHALARRTLRNIRQNLLLALLYNAVMIPLAVSGRLDPRLACIGMASSSLLVVGNALRLRRAASGGPRRRA